MRLAIAGVNHRTAPVQVREQLAFHPEQLPSSLLDLQTRGAKEVLILSTCNRVEVTAALPEDLSMESLFESVLADRSGLDVQALRPHIYVYEDSDAIRHLFRVAASLDSMIVGEPQILGQLKQAVLQAREQGTIGTVLDSVLSRAFNVAKRIRTETEIGESAVSVSYAAVELAREIFGSLKGKRVLIVGAGKMSEGAARNLIRGGATEIFITNRTSSRAVELAELFRGQVIPYEQMPQRLAEMDIVIASSGATDYVLTVPIVKRAIEMRRHQPMFLIDIAVPRNIEPQVNELEHAYLYDIDNLQRLAEQNMQARIEVAQQAEAIVADEVRTLEARLRSRDVAPTILSLQEQLETIRKEVLLRYRGRLGTLTQQQEEALEGLTRGIINKVAHGPISELRRQASKLSAENAADSELISAVRRMFQISDQ
jgi:glutamyl-tRNA reductase